VSLTRVRVDAASPPPKRIVGFFTLSTIHVEAATWPGAIKGLPKQPMTAVLLGRLAVDKVVQD